MNKHRSLFISACYGWQFTGGTCPNPIDALLEALWLEPTGKDYSVDWLKKKLDEGEEPEQLYEWMLRDMEKLDKLKCSFKPLKKLRRKAR